MCIMMVVNYCSVQKFAINEKHVTQESSASLKFIRMLAGELWKICVGEKKTNTKTQESDL